MGRLNDLVPRTPLVVAAAAGLGGYLLNGHGLEFFGRTELVFGGALTLPVAFLFGPRWGALAALLGSLSTLAAWGHPWGAAFHVAEAVAAGWLVHRRRISGVGAVAAFWTIATPLAGMLFVGSHDFAFPSDWAITLKYPANGLLNALIGTVLISCLPSHGPLRLWLEPDRDRTLAQVLFTRFAVLATVPMAIIAILAGRTFDATTRDRTTAELNSSARAVAARLDSFLFEHQRALTLLADTMPASLPPGATMDTLLFQLRRQYPALLTAIVADDRGEIVAASPALGEDGQAIARTGRSVADRDYFTEPLRTRKPHLSGVFQGRGYGRDLVVAVSAPVIRHGRVVAVIEASLGLERFRATLTPTDGDRPRDLVVVDDRGHVVVALGDDSLEPLQAFAGSDVGRAVEAADDGVFEFPRSVGESKPEKRLGSTAIASFSAWRIVLHEPRWRSLRTVAAFYVASLAVCIIVGSGTLWIARRTSRSVTEPLQRLQEAARQLALGAEPPPLAFKGAPADVAAFASDVENAAAQLVAGNRRLRQAIAESDRLNAEITAQRNHLDEMVRARTADLEARNRELGDLVEAQRQAQIALADSDERYRTVVENLSEVVFQTDTKGVLTYLSPAWFRRTGLGIGECVGCRLADFLVEEDRPACAAQFAVLLRGEEVAGQRLRIRCRPDGIRWFDLAARPTRDATDAIAAIAGTLSDVTELVAGEAALRESRERFDLAVRGSGAGLWDWDLGTGAIYFSPRAKEIIGFADDEIANTGVAWFKRVHHEDRPRIVTALRRNVTGRTPVFEVELRLRHRDGAWRWVLGRGAALRNARGRTQRIAGSLVDITELKRAQSTLEERSSELAIANSQLARAARLKDEFLASMSHELRTPLNAVLGMSEVLLEEIPGPLAVEQKECIQTIAESGRHLLELINDILDLSKIEAGKLTLDRTRGEMREVVNACLRFIKEPANKKRINVSANLDEGCEAIVADTRRLKQIFLNLLSNAVKFTPEGGRVGIDVRRAEDRDALVCTVWDTGIGIPQAEMARLFQPFVQIDSKLSRHFGGTGLGLAIVRRLAELHGGSVALESTPGQGSRFSVTLPCETEVEADSIQPALASDANNAGADGQAVARVLLIEDNDRNVATFRKYLEARSCSVAVALTGAEGLDRAKDPGWDVVVLDMQLPGMDGFEVLERLRSQPATASIPVIAVTALSMPGDRERCFARGATGYLEKPVNLRALLAAIRTPRDHARAQN